jgi:hypothetical protein
MKLSALPIILIGLAVGVVVLAYAFFWEYKPNMDQAAFDTEQARALETEANKMPLAKKRVELAEQMVREREAAWSSIVATRTLPSMLARGGINLNQNAWQLVIDARKYRNNAQRAINAQLKKGGVVVVNGPAVPFPDETAPTILANYFNYPAVPFPVVIFDLGTVTVRGNYTQIANHVRSWSTMPNYLAVTDGLQITGTSPQLTGTYNLSVVGYIEVGGLYPPVPEGGAASTGTGGTTPGGPGIPGRAGPSGGPGNGKAVG